MGKGEVYIPCYPGKVVWCACLLISTRCGKGGRVNNPNNGPLIWTQSSGFTSQESPRKYTTDYSFNESQQDAKLDLVVQNALLHTLNIALRTGRPTSPANEHRSRSGRGDLTGDSKKFFQGISKMKMSNRDDVEVKPSDIWRM